MPDIPYPDLKKTPQKVQDFFAKMEANTGRIGNLFRMAAYTPATVREFIRFGDRLLFKSELNGRYRELAILRVSHLCHANYEWAHHVPIALREGITHEQIMQIETWQDSDLFSEDDRVILAFTEEVFHDSRPTEETFAAAAGLMDTTGLMELTLSVGHWSMVAKVLNTFGVENEPDFLEANRDILPDTGPGY